MNALTAIREELSYFDKSVFSAVAKALKPLDALMYASATSE